MSVNQRKAGVILSYLSIIVTTFVTLIYTPIVLRYLGKSEYGVYDLTVSIVSYLSLLSLGFGGSYVRFYYQFKVKDNDEEINKLNGLFLIVYLLMGISSLVVGGIIVKNLDIILRGKMTHEELLLSKKLMTILVINIFLTFPITVFESFITANERFLFQRVLLLLRQVLSPIISVPLLMIGYRSVGLVFVTTIITFLTLVINMYYSFRKLKMKFYFKRLNLSLLKEIAVFSGFLFLNMITDQINWSIDKFVLGKFVGTIGITMYSMGSIINNMYMKMSTSISSVFIPKVNDMVQRNMDDAVISDFFIKIGRIQFYILTLIQLGFLTFGKFFIENIWLDNTYSSSYYIALILIIPVTIPLIQNIGIEIQRAKNLHKFRSIVYFLIAIVNLIISIPLAIEFGPIGSAIGTGITLIIGNGLIMNIYYKNYVGIDINKFWRNILNISKGLIIPLILTFIVLKLGINTKFQFIYLIILYVVVYFASVYKFSMNKYEKNLVLKPIRNIINIVKKK